MLANVTVQQLAGEALCAGPEVDSQWWLDPDTEEGDTWDVQVSENQVRAALLCYQCPIIASCRINFGHEEHNVIGGLTRSDRSSTGKTVSSRQAYLAGLGQRWVEDFLGGKTTGDIAGTHGVDPGYVATTMKGLLGVTRTAWEKRNQCRTSTQTFLLGQESSMRRSAPTETVA